MKIFLFLCIMLIPITLISIGFLWKRKAPKNRNDLYGYRTTRSMLSQGTWDYAHKYFANLSLGVGSTVLILSIIVFFFIKDLFRFESYSIYIIYIQSAILVLLIIPTEIALKKMFDKHGRKRKNDITNK